MKAFARFVCLLSVSVMSVTGCDFMRSIAGRPTSADLAEMREMLEEQDTCVISDSLTVEVPDTIFRENEKDSLDAVSYLSERAHAVVKRSIPSLKYRYYLVVGSFKMSANAENLVSALKDAGYADSGSITMNSGITCVYVCGSDSLSEIVRTLKRVEGGPFYSSGIWIWENV